MINFPRTRDGKFSYKLLILYNSIAKKRLTIGINNNHNTILGYKITFIWSWSWFGINVIKPGHHVVYIT